MVTIDGCQVTDFSYTEPDAVYTGTYPSGAMTISIPSWSVLPATCGVSAVFEAKWYENGIYKSLPSFITYSATGHSFNVELDDYNNAGTYVISLVG